MINSNAPMQGSLVAYKGRAAKIINQTTHKFEIEFFDKSTLRVREKDFRFIHHDFAKVSDDCLAVDLVILSDLQEEALFLKEVTEWLFDEYSPQNAWQVYLLVEDGLYFYWQKNKIFIRPTEQVLSIKNKREAEALEIKNLQSCVDNIKSGIIDKKDEPYLKEIEKVALNHSKHTKILTLLKVDNTPEAAHRLLLKLKYWDMSFNPYPARNKILKDEDIVISDKDDVDRVDLTHLKSFAIDNAGSTDADDALSVNGDKIWVHIADVSSITAPESELDLYAQKRASNLYLPEQIIHMLPLGVTDLYSLGAGKISKALSVSFTIKDNDITDVQIQKTIIKVSNISYDDSDKNFESNKHLNKLKIIADKHKKYREERGAISLNLPKVDVRFKDNEVLIKPQKSSQSREMVAEMMILAGRVVALFAQENDIAMPYAIQDKGDFPDEVLANKNNLSLSKSFQATKYFKRSKTSTKPLLHYGLGLDAYLRVTSPLRRYFDLLAHQQLSSFINNQPTLSEKDIKERISKINTLMPNIFKTIRNSDDFFKCLYLKQNPNWRGDGSVIDKRGDNALLMIDTLGMISQVKIKTKIELDEKIKLKVAKVDLIERIVVFKEKQ